MKTLDVSGHTGGVSIGAYFGEDGETIAIEIIEADQKIKVTAGILISLLQARSPWVEFDGDLLRVTDRTRTVIYRLDGVDIESGVFYFSWPD